MDSATHTDAIWSAFCGTLPPQSQSDAQQLALWLGLAPEAGIPWSNVFKHEVTLAAPALFADAMPQASGHLLRLAVTAHMLAVIEAFATDRVQDGQVVSSSELQQLLGHRRRGRDRSMRQLSNGCPPPHRGAEQQAVAAIAREQHLLQGGSPVSFEEYARVSLAKQTPAFPASIALAQAAGWSIRRQQAVQRTLGAVFLGLQFADDVVDWEDDWQGGAAWAVSLSRGLHPSGTDPHWASESERLQERVHESGALAQMLGLSRQRFRDAARLAKALGATRLAAWACQQETRAAELAECERDSAGYAVRAHLLARWAAEVLA